MAGANGDLAAKYQRLATEYAKLKAQIPVLKKAVIDEQTKVGEEIRIDKRQDRDTDRQRLAFHRRTNRCWQGDRDKEGDRQRLAFHRQTNRGCQIDSD